MKKGFVLSILAVASLAWAYRHGNEVSEMAAAAQQFLASLRSEQRAQTTFSLGDEQRYDWHYVPRARKGTSFKQLDPAQQKLAHALLAAALSRSGYITVSNIMYLERVLYELENGRPHRDPDLYYFSIFGEPSITGDWGWRVEGHHLSLNFTLYKGRVVSSTPAFLGANPAEVRQGPSRGLRTLPLEEDLARELFKSFQGAHREKVLIDVTAPADIITRASRKAEMAAPAGVSLDEMSREQAQLLMGLLEHYAHRLRSELAEQELNKIRQTGLEKVHFAWAGGSEPGQPHYYRIQGPTFVVEYDNTQNGANHIHTVWRNFENDFGRDLLGEHYAQSHGRKHAPGQHVRGSQHAGLQAK